MPPAPKKDCAVILFDLAAAGKKPLQTFLKIACLNHFSETKDLCKLVLLNSDTTENVNARPGINEVADVMIYHPRLQLEMIESSGTGDANWLEGLLVALKNLDEEFESIGGIITLQLLFITDLARPLTRCNQRQINEIIEKINKLGAFLYIVGPDVPVPYTINKPDDIKSWMNNLKVDENDNLRIAKEIVTNTKHSVICDFKMGIHLFFSFRNWGGTQPWQVPLGIGTKVKIPAQTMKILNEGMPCKLTTTERFGDYMWIDGGDESVEIRHDEVRSGISRHGKFVILEDNNKMFQVENPRGFDVLCFTNSTNVPEYLMGGEGCYCVLPNGRRDQNEAMDTLIDCLAEQKKYIIARRVYNANYVPKIVALVPKPEHNPKCFYLTTLPFGEDIRYNYNEKKVEAAPQVEVIDEVYKFLDSVNIEENKELIPLGVTMMVDHNSIKLINKCCDKLLEKNMSLEEVDIDYTSGETSTGDDLKRMWIERKVDEVKKDQKDDEENSEDELVW